MVTSRFTSFLWRLAIVLLGLGLLRCGAVFGENSPPVVVSDAVVADESSATGYMVQGSAILAPSGKPLLLRGVSWFGFETRDHVVHGLWARNWQEMIDQMAQVGVNAVRIPICPDTLRGSAVSSIDYSLNPDLQGLNSLEILDRIVQAFDARGFYILLDHHRPDCKAISELWYTASYNEQAWIDDLVFLAQRYAERPYFLGLDLKNEPHGAATWGAGNLTTDWNQAAQRAAAAVLEANPNILVFVEGVQENPTCSGAQSHWWGGNLEPLACTPLTIPAHKLVLSPHVYGPDVYVQPYFGAEDFPLNMPAIWEAHFGRFAGNYAVVIGEFGGRYGHGGDARDGVWQDALVDYLIQKEIRSSFYWSWNPNSGDTGGILQDDWTRVWKDKVALLHRLWGLADPPPTAMPTATSTPTPPPADLCLQDVNANGQGDVLDIVAALTHPGCELYLPLLTSRWRQPLPPTLTLTPSSSSTPTVAPSKTPTPTPLPTATSTPAASSHITAIWANEGGDKVWRSELRGSQDPASVLNAVWDGHALRLFGARNEVLGFNLILEAAKAPAANVRVRLDELVGPGGARIAGRSASGDDLFNFVGQNIELFYVRYLEIKGLSIDLAYDDYDERHIPERCRRPYDQYGVGTGTWEDRPCHNQFYPDIAVPLTLHTPFSIAAGTNQAIWGDIFIPKDAPAGLYNGEIVISEDSAVTARIPLHLQVRDFTLPDLPSARTMVYFSEEDINERYLGESYPDPGSEAYAQSQKIIDRHFQLAHRHKLSLIDGGANAPTQMAAAWLPRLRGDLFTLARGYDGPGVGVGNNVYSIGTYGSWDWQGEGKQSMWTHTDAWVNWFEAQAFSTPTAYFLYLIDESDDFAQIEQWAQWMNQNPGPGRRLPSLATIALPDAIAHTPSLDIPTSGAGFGITTAWENALAALRANPDKHFWMYNGSRPGSGSFAIEDEGVALRELAWGGFKKGVERWFYWESTYYTNFQCYGYHDPRAFTNLFQQAQTFGCYSYDDASRGQAGWNYFNGDGVLFYPGTDTRYPEDSYGLAGPFASLRMKLWRRGIQDVDYLVLAEKIDPVRVRQIVERMAPTVLWEYGVDDPNDPTWVRTDISWSTNPDDWEAVRAELAEIIESGLHARSAPPQTAAKGQARMPR